MWWTVLYIAFGVVALWLLGEVLLQYKARLRWRLLAFGGFLGVVIGVLLPSVLVIVVGALAFALGQTYVTLSFRRGFSTGWALGGNPGASRRRRSGPPAKEGPTLEVSDLAYEPAHEAADGPDGYPAAGRDAESGAVYEPEPMPEDTGQYAVYGTSYDQQQPQYADPYAGYEQQPGYDYGTDAGRQYAAYSDPYIGQQTYTDAGQQYGTYQQPYDDPYAPSYVYDTPPGGVWVPQQRDTEQQEQQQQYGYGEDQQYRY
ncbi:hypothetical protein [Streptomyces roseicoloratus]|uniref:Integral membrane protein n=1 Tax=Streptomyces roseicoloratus TaxID=2508722 RepID=A0ABY9RZ85_9ACTN|nr:hypothetical protein [Streptomyces roseicoloratus]WMX47496.1 hypothetical protein RGF97_25465 [Streptomyces roseicoloratus]